MGKSKRRLMKDLPLEDRPYEKLELQGRAHLSSAELLSVILINGSGGQTALDLARSLLADDRSLRALSEMSLEELQGFYGIGRSKAIRLHAAFEIATRLYSSYGMEVHPSIGRPEDVIQLMESELIPLPREELHVLMLDVRGRMIRRLKVSGGGSTHTSVFPKDLFREAIRANANAIILCHNHPSGDSSPSEYDIRSSKELQEMGDKLGITLLDHIIIAGKGSISLREKGYL